MSATRRSVEESLAFLRERAHPVKMPRQKVRFPWDRPELGYEMDFLGLRFSGVTLAEVDLDGLSLPRTLFEQSRFLGVSFRNSDLKLSLLHAVDVVDCDFTDADLVRVEATTATFFACRFTGAILIGADLCRATFENCDFAGANLTGARLYRTWRDRLELSDHQRRFEVNWQDENQEDEDEGSDE
jgi:hypothetical protein